VAQEVRQEGRSVDDVSRRKSRRNHTKKKSKRATERLRDDVIERKKAFIEEIKAFDFDRLIFLDECGVNTSMTPRYARAMRGQRALCHVPFQRGTNISVLASVTARGVLAWNAYDGANVSLRSSSTSCFQRSAEATCS
jgi:hypothetical protein